jgi:hypothetical protein
MLHLAALGGNGLSSLSLGTGRFFDIDSSATDIGKSLEQKE